MQPQKALVLIPAIALALSLGTAASAQQTQSGAANQQGQAEMPTTKHQEEVLKPVKEGEVSERAQDPTGTAGTDKMPSTQHQRETLKTVEPKSN